MDKPEMVGRAEEAIDEHTEPQGERKYASGSSREELRREQQDEAAQAWVGPGVPAMTGGQWRGLLAGSLIGGALGALLFLPLALVDFMDPTWLRILLVLVAGALAGGTAGALYAGGREPELEGETVDADGRPSVGSTQRDRHTDSRGR
jgi:hypothetical protein